MSFSIFTFISTQLIISLMIILIFAFMKSNKFMCRYGIFFILIPISACLFRSILPFETFYTIVLSSFNILTKIYDLYSSTYMGYKISWYIHLVAIFGSTVSAVLLIKDFYSIYVLKYQCINISCQKIIRDILTQIKEQRGYDINIRIMLCNNISTPFVFGYIQPTIYMPKIDYSERELYYILDHELVHWFHKDLWIKLIVQIVSIVYWWNPTIYLLKNILAHTLELKCDAHIVQGLNTEEKIEYLNALMRTIESSPDNVNNSLVTTNFIGKNQKDNVIQRFNMVFDYDFSLNRHKILPIIFSILLFIISYSITIQPAYLPPEMDYLGADGKGISIDPGTSYISSLDGSYYLFYAEGKSYKLTQNQLQELIDVGIRIKNNKGALK